MPVNSPGEFARDEHIKIRELIQTVDHPLLGEHEQVGFPVLMEGQRVPARPAPLLGQHTISVLGDRLGLSVEEVEILFAQGIS